MARTVNPEKHEEKRAEILEAAHRCFLRHGLQGASISIICKEAGIGPGHLYHYFENKQAIVEAMASDYLARLHGHFGQHPEGQDTPTILLSELWSMTNWQELDHCRILFELLAEAGRSEGIREIMRANMEGIRELLTRTLAAGQARGEVDPELDPDHTGAVLVAVLDAASTLPLRAPDLDFAISRELFTRMARRFLKPQ